METTAEVQPKKSTTMRYRKNTVEEDEQEIQELEKARAGKKKRQKKNLIILKKKLLRKDMEILEDIFKRKRMNIEKS